MIIRKNDKKVELKQEADVKGDDIFENKIMALIFDIVFLVYSIIYSKFQQLIEYLFFMVIFKITTMGIGDKAKSLYELTKTAP